MTVLLCHIKSIKSVFIFCVIQMHNKEKETKIRNLIKAIITLQILKNKVKKRINILNYSMIQQETNYLLLFPILYQTDY